MVFILPAEFRVPDESDEDREFEESVAQLTLGLQPIMFEKP